MLFKLSEICLYRIDSGISLSQYKCGLQLRAIMSSLCRH